MAEYVHFVGSVPLGSTEEVLASISRSVGKHLKSIPDGETNERKSFVQWQKIHFPANVRKPLFDGSPRPDHPPTDLTLGDIRPLRYDTAAIGSFTLFESVSRRDSLPTNTRFQVCLPSPLGVVRSLIETNYCAQVENLYEERMMQVLDNIQRHIPAQKLLIQWDVPIEMAMQEIEKGRLTEAFFTEFFHPFFSPVKQGIMNRWLRLCKAIHPQVQIGFHLCYGNYKQQHWLDPQTLDLAVEVTNLITTQIAPVHPVEYVHMPVPKHRTDEEFYLPLKDLSSGHPRIILGVIHGFDLDGTRKRIDAARCVLNAPFGISTECGMTGKSNDYYESVLAICSKVME